MERIKREHPDYVRRRDMWRKYRDLYAGGEQIRENAAEYLIRRHKEPQQIFAERIDRVFYENYVGSIIDWYGATLMRRKPALLVEGGDAAARAFLAEFSDDCDLKGTDLAEFMRQRFVDTLVYGRSYVVADFPRADGTPQSRAEEDAIGRSRAFLADYSPEELINWSYDKNGALEWVVLRTSGLRVSEESADGWEKETRWLYYDREEYRLYAERRGKIALEDAGRHGMAGLRRVPLFQMQVTDGLWLMNKAALLQLEHFNKSNALGWALTMGLFATPVVYSEREFNQIVGESYYIQLGSGDRFGWTEPDGKVYQIAADNLVRLKEEIYRVCYLLSQAGGVSPVQSGLSKQRDYSITHEVLRAYGDAVKETMRQVLRAVAAARQDEVTVDVAGLDEFDIGDFVGELDEAKKLLDLGIGSETLKKEIFQKLAMEYLCDARQEVKQKVAAEIRGERD